MKILFLFISSTKPQQKKPYRLQSSQLKISKVFICNKIIYSMNNGKNVAKSLPRSKQICLE